ncbi:unnamed protein product [Effrenium voratum]|nr:unnamed protein product [Effrenium voratum]
MTDVVVIGAGISGLVCARELLRKGLSVTILEASDRVGGRTFSVSSDSGSRVDLGGQWVAVEGQQPHIRQLMRELGLEVHPQHYQGQRVLDLQSREAPLHYNSDIPSGIGVGGLVAVQCAIWWCAIRARLSVGPAASCDRNGKLARFDAQSAAVLEKMVGNSGKGATKGLVAAMVRGVFGCEPQELSWLHMLHYAACAGGVERLLKIKGGFQEFTIVGGAQQVSELLAKEVTSLGGKLEFGARVTHVKTSEGSVEVRGSGSTTRCSRLVCALPPANLKAVTFEPPLPSSRQALHEANFIGCIIKSVIRYGQPFWRNKGFSGEVVAESTAEEPVFNCYDHCIGDSHFLVCFMNGAPAKLWSSRSQAERKEVVLKQLTKWFGQEANEPLEFLEKDWVADEFTTGCPVGCYPPNTLAPHMQALREPCGLIHWAGTESADSCQGFMDGAVQAAQRCAREVIAALEAARA